MHDYGWHAATLYLQGEGVQHAGNAISRMALRRNIRQTFLAHRSAKGRPSLTPVLFDCLPWSTH